MSPQHPSRSTGPEADRRPVTAPNIAAPAVPSEHILQGQRSVAIEHNGSVYRLQATRQGKLILTK